MYVLFVCVLCGRQIYIKPFSKVRLYNRAVLQINNLFYVMFFYVIFCCVFKWYHGLLFYFCFVFLLFVYYIKLSYQAYITLHGSQTIQSYVSSEPLCFSGMVILSLSLIFCSYYNCIEQWHQLSYTINHDQSLWHSKSSN